jgi:hypothetical protein
MSLTTSGSHQRGTGSNPGSKLSATEPKSEQLRPLQNAEEHRVRLDRSGWGPGGRRFKSCLPDRDLPAKREEPLVGALPRGAFQGANFAPHLHPAASQFGPPSRFGNLRPQGLEPRGRRLAMCPSVSRRSLVRTSQVPGRGVRERGASLVGEAVGGSGRLELGHLLFDLLVCVIVWSREDERDRLG